MAIGCKVFKSCYIAVFVPIWMLMIVVKDLQKSTVTTRTTCSYLLVLSLPILSAHYIFSLDQKRMFTSWISCLALPPPRVIMILRD